MVSYADKTTYPWNIELSYGAAGWSGGIAYLDAGEHSIFFSYIVNRIHSIFYLES